MTKVRVDAFSISLDGYGAGPDQTRAEPLGRGGEALHDWFVPTSSFQHQFGREGGTGGIDDAFAARAVTGVGAVILGRNMFGPVRGPWPDDSWRGWWGDNPPYHCPTFVLTHHEREPAVMEGGTTFHFVTGGIREALDRAREAAGDKDIRIGGGAETIRQYLVAGLIDELHIAVAPILLGSGEPLFAGLDLPALGFEVVEQAASDLASHYVLRRTGDKK